MLTVTEVCTQLRIGKTKFYGLINSGELEAVDVSGRNAASRRVGQPGRRRTLRIERAQVDAYIERNRVPVST